MKQRVAVGGMILLLATAALVPLAREGIAGSDDILDGIYRLFALHASWQDRIFYPRLAADLAYAYSAPLFQFYPPLASYVAEVFHLAGLGFIGAIKATYLLGLALAGLGMYLYGQILLRSRPAALLAAVAYIYAPYQLADIYVRGATAEALALALFPWILWAFHGLHATGGRDWFLYGSAALAALFLTHNSLALFFVPILLAYLVALDYEPGNVGRRVWPCVAAVALALGLSAFFWLPAIAERGYVDISDLTQGFYDPVNHLTTWHKLIQTNWLYDYVASRDLRWGLAPAALALLGLATWPWQPRATRRWMVFYTAVIAVALLLQTTSTAPFWQNAPLVRFIQFPWRLLAFVSLAGAPLIAALPGAVAHLRPCCRGNPLWLPYRNPFSAGKLPGLRVWITAGLLAAALIVTATAKLWPGYLAAWQAGHFNEGDISRQDMYERGRLGFELFSDYQPVWVQVPMADVPNGRPASPEPQRQRIPAAPWPAPTVQVLGAQAFAAAVRVETTATFPLTLHRFYFPGWQAQVDGRPAPAYPSGELGLVTVDVPPGTHTVELRFGDTPVRRAAAGVAGGCLLILLGVCRPVLRRRLWLAGLLAVLILSGAGAWGVIRFSAAPLRRSPAPAGQETVQANLGDQAQLVGYTLDRPAYRPGETVRLTLYWLGLRPADRDYEVRFAKVFVHLRDLADQQMFGQHDGAPVYGFTPITRWEPGELLADEHPLRLADTIPPGKYQLVVGMYDPDSMQNVPVRRAVQVLPGERVLLGQIEVVAARR